MKVRSLGIALLMVGLAAACGAGGTSGDAAQPAASIGVAMTESKFNPSTIDAKAGKVVLRLTNNGSTSHDMVVLDPSGARVVAKSALVQPGSSSTFTVGNLKAGSYTVFCDRPGHRRAGMQATLSVS